MIPAQAVEAAWRDDNANPKRKISRSEIWALLEAAAPYMESERVEALKHELSLAQAKLRNRP